MKMDVLKENENKLLHRKELDIVLKDLTATPSKKDIIATVSANLGAPENAIVLGSIHQKFGKREARVYVRVYENEEEKKSIELKPKDKKEVKEEPKKEGEKK
jgi:ribosomal protein S24E